MPEEEVNSQVSGGFDLLGSILSNPEMLSKISTILSELGSVGADGSTAASTSASTDAGFPNDTTSADVNSDTDVGASDTGGDGESINTGAGGLPGGLSALLANKELMAKLPDLLSGLKGAVPAGTFGKGGLPTPPHHHHGKHPVDRRIALMLALKPYMSGHRREAIDYFIKINKFGDMFRGLI